VTKLILPPADVVPLRLGGAIAAAPPAGFGYLVDRIFVICLTGAGPRLWRSWTMTGCSCYARAA